MDTLVLVTPILFLLYTFLQNYCNFELHISEDIYMPILLRYVVPCYCDNAFLWDISISFLVTFETILLNDCVAFAISSRNVVIPS